MGFFVNPYTFVPFASGDEVALDRREPLGHLAPQLGAWHGVLECELEALSRLLVRWPVAGTEEYAAPSRLLPDGARRYIVPGSSLHGAVRSLHEVLAGGCLRVFDETFVPSYRDQMRAGGHGDWRLAVVEEVDAKGSPTKLRLADSLAYLPQPGWRDRAPKAGGFWVAVSEDGLPAGLTTGDRLDLNIANLPVSELPHRPQFTQVAAVPNPAGQWVVLFTDPRTRTGRGYFAAVGHLGGQTATVSEEAWKDFQTAAAGSDDYREANKKRRPDLAFADTKEPKPIEVLHEGKHIGYRHAVYPFLHQGQVVWVQTERVGAGYRVTAMKASWFWRHGGKYPAGCRVPETLKPCREPDRLCPSCRLFGSADTGGREEDEQAWQASYRGHVRVHDAQAIGEVTTEAVRLAPMGAPRPGAGQFYLSTGGSSQTAAEAAHPIREWGSGSDEPQPRRLRGRKMYWRTTEQQGRRRFAARTHQSAHEMSKVAQVFAAGSRFRVRITFENLTEAEVGALVVALDPGRLFRRVRDDAVGASLAEATRPAGHEAGKDEFVLPVGGGKPLGFGSCVARNIKVHRVDPKLRYSGPTEVAQTRLAGKDLDALVDTFVADRQQVTAWLARQWAHVSRALRVDHVDPSLVWYPPGAEWSTLDKAATVGDEKARSDLEKAFDDPFTFFQRSIGWSRGEERYPLTELPRIDATDQQLGIVS